ncbi:hypothetical protein ONZ43_g2335 [Nemania bipapillata]|uniref:Uncharacterized protein n=1 Tax=Nemania bipapillata TaxID=110536 RepID=A0ACC2J1E3_9PEZI|nr:hypothetical protein ONZ43_g2335 [Nemania bipapillata]
MVRVTEELALSPDHVTLYQATDPLLGHLPILIFHGPSTTANYTFNSSRVQVHIYTPAGLQSFPRLTISPNSPFYNVVHHLPREFQGDEVYRALAFGLSKYFHELPEPVKGHIKQQYPTTRGRRPGSSPALFGDQHAADIAKSMVRAENTADVIQKLQVALQTQHVSNVDVDLVLPPGSIIPLQPADFEEIPEDEDDILDPTLRQYGIYSPLVKLFGEPVFLPTTRLRRAPSKPSALNRTKSFSKDQKLELRRKMTELVETEERYVAKLDELVRQVANDYRRKAENRQPDSFSPSSEDVDRLFPRSSDQILQINTDFMQELRNVLDDTEQTAQKDADSGTSSSRVGPSGSLLGKTKDASGAVAMAKVMLEWFPKFTDCYQDYIRASQNFPQLITSFINQQSTFTDRVAITGEQHLRSTVIEPVQRLPRYSLMIDQIVGCLPITHPALQPMLKARDIIANICSMDDPLTSKPHVSTRLRNMIESWPSDLDPQGRLITAADFSEVPAPYQNMNTTETEVDERAGMFLVFSDCIIIVKKLYGIHMTARDLLREIDKPSAAGLLASMTNAAGGPGSYDLAFAGWHELAGIRFTESADGRLFAAVFQEGLDQLIEGRKEPAPIRIVVDHEKGTKGSPVGHYGVEICSDVRTGDLKKVVMITVGLHGKRATDEVALEDFLPTLSRRIIQFLSTQFNVANPGLTPALVSFNTKILRGLSVSNRTEKTRSFLASSPVKYLSSFLGGSSSTDANTPKFQRTLTGESSSLSSTFLPGQISRSNSTRDAASLYGSVKSRDGMRTGLDDDRPENPIFKLEQTFTGYMASLLERKGSFVGRTLLNRSAVDELSVNDLYNKLIENPFEIETAQDVAADVVFVAFEKFVRIAWRNQMGPIITTKALDALQERASKRLPGDFADFVHYLFADMAPQNPSRDRPPIAGAFDDVFSRPTSSHKLETIGEPGDEIAVRAPKKKRRSSLSDLKSLMEATNIDDEPPIQPLSHMKETSERFNSTPRVASPSKIPVSPNTYQYSNSPAFRSTKQKENTDDPFKPSSPSSQASRKPHPKVLSSSNIPTLKPSRDLGRGDSADSPTRPPASPTKASGKLRLQSPQKLRERLQVEKEAVEQVDANLRSELSKISADMARVNANLPRSETVDIRKISSSVQALEERLPGLLGQLTNRQDQLQKDMENTVKASETKVKAIDQLYKEAMAENELLYERFNSELGKIVKALKGKGREEKEELVGRIKDSSEETARLKKDNARLKREMISLRALIKGGGTGSTGDA